MQAEAENERLMKWAMKSDEDNDKLRAQIADLHAAYSHSQQQFLDGENELDRLRTENERLAAEGQRVLDKMNAYKADCEEPRELVREVIDGKTELEWFERAVKALGGK